MEAVEHLFHVIICAGAVIMSSKDARVVLARSTEGSNDWKPKSRSQYPTATVAVTRRTDEP
jgi:hypothetical protein